MTSARAMTRPRPQPSSRSSRAMNSPSSLTSSSRPRTRRRFMRVGREAWMATSVKSWPSLWRKTSSSASLRTPSMTAMLGWSCRMRSTVFSAQTPGPKSVRICIATSATLPESMGRPRRRTSSQMKSPMRSTGMFCFLATSAATPFPAPGMPVKAMTRIAPAKAGGPEKAIPADAASGGPQRGLDLLDVVRGEDTLPALRGLAVVEDDDRGHDAQRVDVPEGVVLVAHVHDPPFADALEVRQEAVAVAAPVGAEEHGDAAGREVGGAEAGARDLADHRDAVSRALPSSFARGEASDHSPRWNGKPQSGSGEGAGTGASASP